MSSENRPITAASVTQVRNATDMPIMEAKRFLQHYGGDVERAIQAGLSNERLPQPRQPALSHPDITPAAVTRESIVAVMSSGVGMSAAREYLYMLSGDVLMAAGYARSVNKAVMIRGGPDARERWDLSQAASFKQSHFIHEDLIVPAGMDPTEWRRSLGHEGDTSVEEGANSERSRRLVKKPGSRA